MGTPSWGTSNAFLSGESQERPYAQHRVNIKVKFDDSTRGRLVVNEENMRRAIYVGASKPNVFDLMPWEAGFELEDGYNASDDGFPRILTALNGVGDDHMADILSQGDQQWVAMLITEKLRYVGHPTKQWNSNTGKLDQSLGAQMLGVRSFFAFEEAPLNSLLQYRAPTIDEAQEFIKNSPQGTSQGKVTLIAVPYKLSDVSTTLKIYNSYYLNNPADFQKLLNAKYQRTTKVIKMITKFHNFVLLAGLSMIYSFVRDNVFQIHIPNNATLKPTTDALTLDVDYTANYLLALATKLHLLQNTNYPQIARNDNSEDTKRRFADYRLHLLRTVFPSNNAYYYFGYNKADGNIPGIDMFNKNLRTGTAHGDMIEAIEKSGPDAFSAIADFIYHSTKNIAGRVITPARKFNMGSFI